MSNHIRVFITYSHDSSEHMQRVLAFSERLRKDGIDAQVDQYVNGTPSEGWPRWMLHQLDVAEFVLLICTETYYRRFRGYEQPGKSTGANWNGALLTQEVYDARRQTVRFVPILFDPGDEQYIPEPLHSSTHYTVTSEPGYERLYDFLLGRAGVEPGALGLVRRTREGKAGAAPDETGVGPEGNSFRTSDDVPSPATSLSEALAAYEATLARLPNDMVAQTGRAEVLREMERLPEALEAYEAVIYSFPYNVVAHTGRAEVLKEMGRLPEALDAYEEITQRFPDDIVAETGRAGVLLEMGRQTRTLNSDLAVKHTPEATVTPVREAETPTNTADPREAPPAPEHGYREEHVQLRSGFSVAPASISDQPAVRDALGFEPYVRAVAEFLTNEGTKPPLTLSIEGDWGSGKSSFMQQLQRAIQARQKEKGRQAAVTVWFNPWRHDREEAVWAAFALEFLRGVSEQLPFTERWRGHLKLLYRRFSWRDGWLDIIRAFMTSVASLAGIGILGYLVFADGGAMIARFTQAIAGDDADNGLLTTLFKTGGAGASLAVAITLLKQAKSYIGNPLRFDLKRYVQSPDYQSRISFIEHFHEDFGRIVKAYVGERKVFVFIDDLDRCQTPKAADLMQALNLMMGAGEQPIVFILGMDREKIAASLAVKFKDLLPYVTANPARPGNIEDGEAALRGLEYGSEFIEKFVQLSFRIPQPGDSDVAVLLHSISGDGKPSAAPATASTIPSTESTLLTQIPVDPSGPVRPRPVRESGLSDPNEPVRTVLQEEVAVDSERLHEIVRMVAPALDYNPRRVKQFVNVFRLRAYLAIATGLVGAGDPDRPEALTFEKLGKFVALGLRWPMLLADLDNERDLLERLQARAIDPLGPVLPRGAEAFWAERQRLLELLSVGMAAPWGDSSPHGYSMKGLNVDALLQVTAPPSVRYGAGGTNVERPSVAVG